jgi:hypothetical protein
MLVRARLRSKFPDAGHVPLEAVRRHNFATLCRECAGLDHPELRLRPAVLDRPGRRRHFRPVRERAPNAAMDGDELTLMALPGGQCCGWTREQHALLYNPPDFEVG